MRCEPSFNPDWLAWFERGNGTAGDRNQKVLGNAVRGRAAERDWELLSHRVALRPELQNQKPLPA